MDDYVEAAPTYRSDSRAGQPVIRLHENHDLHMKWEHTQMESQQKQQTQLKTVPKLRSLYKSIQNPGDMMSTHGSL